MAKKKKARRGADRPRESEPECNFEESLAELEQIVSELECGDLGLEQALDRYEQGIRHLKQCHAQLSKVSRRIELLSGVDAAGNPIVVPFDDDESDSLEEKQASRGRRRKAAGGASPPRTSVDDDPRLF